MPCGHCELALQARLLVAAGRDFEFANDLIREALYATTPEPIRLAYHQRAADLLTSQPESLARHAAASGDWLRAARALLSAADEAFRRFAVTDSAALAYAGAGGGGTGRGSRGRRPRPGHPRPGARGGGRAPCGAGRLLGRSGSGTRGG